MPEDEVRSAEEVDASELDSPETPEESAMVRDQLDSMTDEEFAASPY